MRRWRCTRGQTRRWARSQLISVCRGSRCGCGCSRQIERGERDGLTGDEGEELRELRRRVLLLEQEREILKKAAAFFAKESETR